MMKEIKSNWDVVAQKMKEIKLLKLGKYASYWMRQTPRRMLHSQSYYKFASKMIGTQKRVLDIGCNDGMGTFLLGKECGFALGVDFDEEAIASASSNFSDETVSFLCKDFMEFTSEQMFDAITNFDVIEHIYPENAKKYISRACDLLTNYGVYILGTPSKISQEFASEISKKGHVNIYSYQRLYKELSPFFQHVFIFSANDEMIHTGFSELAHYFIAVCTGKKKKL